MKQVRTTHTVVELEVSRAAYAEIKTKLLEAGYDHVFDGNLIDMNGIGLVPAPTEADKLVDLLEKCAEA